MGGPRTDFAFPRALEAALLRDGRPVELRTITVPSERTKTAVRTWEREVIGFSPDVVVLVYGHYETIHLFLPWWLERHANSLTAPHRKLNDFYRDKIVHPTWMSLAKLQAKADTRFDSTIRTDRPRNVANDLEKIIGHLQDVGSPLVYLFELLPPAKRYRSWFPGMAARIEVMNETLADLVKRIDRPNVRLLRVSELVDRYAGGDMDVATPDGFHYSPYLHRMIGEELARDVAAWADSQPHLQLDGGGASGGSAGSDGESLQ
jgi:hypothetical protein